MTEVRLHEDSTSWVSCLVLTLIGSVFAGAAVFLALNLASGEGDTTRIQGIGGSALVVVSCAAGIFGAAIARKDLQRGATLLTWATIGVVAGEVVALLAVAIFTIPFAAIPIGAAAGLTARQRRRAARIAAGEPPVGASSPWVLAVVTVSIALAVAALVIGGCIALLNGINTS